MLSTIEDQLSWIQATLLPAPLEAVKLGGLCAGLQPVALARNLMKFASKTPGEHQDIKT